jgi:hypothetical protein
MPLYGGFLGSTPRASSVSKPRKASTFAFQTLPELVSIPQR